MESVEVGKVYRHFKGNYCLVEDIALDSRTCQRMVVYKPLYSGEHSCSWVRPEYEFLEELPEGREDNITGQAIRFELVENLHKDYTVE